MAAERGPGPGWVVNSISGTVVIGSVIQGRDITVQLPPQVPLATSGLPAPSPAFTGRQADLDRLLKALAPPTGDGKDDDGQRPTAVVVGGMAGVGKTELAVQAARAALRNGWFPGGVLAIDLHGYDVETTRLDAGQALANLLRGLGVPDEVIPAAFDERVRMYRAILAAYAEQGRPILVVIDNASPQAPAEALLPGAGVPVVTSRHKMTDLPGRLLDLPVLPDPAAVELLERLLTAKLGAPDPRVLGHPADAERVAELCAGLPLAVEIVAALLAAHPRKPLAQMAADLRQEQTRLEEMAFGQRAVRAAFDLSYQALPADEQRMLRLITVNPGPQISTPAAAATAWLWEPEARQLIERLAEAHLIEPGDPYGWWRMHDLVRLYATELADHRDQALARLLTYYLDTASAAAAHLDPTVTDPAARGFGTREQALDWLDVELSNLAAAAQAAAERHPDIAIGLPLDLAGYLDWRRLFNDSITLTTLALETARQTGDRHGEGAALNNLGIALRKVGRFEEAITAHQQGLAICRELGDRRGEGGALNGLGLALAGMQRFEEAIAALTDVATICRELGDRHGEGIVLSNLGLALQEVRRFEEAVTAYTDAAGIFEQFGDEHSRGIALGNLEQARRNASPLPASPGGAGREARPSGSDWREGSTRNEFSGTAYGPVLMGRDMAGTVVGIPVNLQVADVSPGGLSGAPGTLDEVQREQRQRLEALIAREGEERVTQALENVFGSLRSVLATVDRRAKEER